MLVKRVFFLVLIGLFITLVSTCESGDKKEYSENTKQSVSSAHFIGDEACQNCHKEQHQEWHNSHHDWAMKEPVDSTVFGDFNNKKEIIDGIEYFFYRSKNLYKVDVTEQNRAKKSYIISYTFGFFPLQQYLIEGENGEVHTLRATWNTEEKKWYHQYSGDKIAPHDWLHWTKGGQRWNTMCADCHSTDVRKNYDIEKQTFDTKFKTINVGCESCHGKGSDHIEWTKNGQEGNNGIFKPENQDAVLNQCAPCHARRAKLSENPNPWESFSQNFLIQNISPAFYELDGQIKEEDYVFGSFLSSKMYHEGVKCTDCHNPHSLKLKAEGNNLCLSCHEPEYDSKKHHQHELKTEGSECISCHMPGKNYMGHDFRRDHSFRVPRPDQSVLFGTPNACNDCHKDKSSKWASNKIIDWYGPDRQPHFSDYLIKSSNPEFNAEEQKELISFINNKKFPEIARSTVAENLTNKISQESFTELIQNLDSKDHLVLNSVLNMFLQESPEARLFLARKHIFHSEKIIRITATKLLLDIPLNQLSPDEQNQLKKTEIELLNMLEISADFPTGRLQLGDYYYKKRNLETAKKHYEIAVEMDSLLTPVYPNLATVYNLLKDNESALKTLETAIFLSPNDGQLEYLKGLLQYEIGQKEKAIKSLNRSINKTPFLIKGYYNLAVIYFEANDFVSAKKILTKGLKIAPSSKDLQDFLALITVKIG
jgi:predicted CXXCH cytochrome family protein